MKQLTKLSQIYTIKALARKLDMKGEEQKVCKQIAGKPLESLNVQELDQVEAYFKKEYAARKPAFDRMKSKILHLATAVFGWDLQGFEASGWPHFNNWMLSQSAAKKPMYKCSAKELAKVITQLEKIQKKQYD